MLVHDFALLARPCAEMSDRLRDRGADLLADALRAALHESIGDVHPAIDVRALLDGAQAYVLPFELRIDGVHSVFHRLQGDLELFAIEADSCQLRLLASYAPVGPASPSRVDHARVERTVRSVLNHLTRELEAGVPVRPGHG